MMRTRALLIFGIISATLACAVSNAQPAMAAFDKDSIIDNAIFDNSQTMSANDIQNFLNGFPNSCLKNYQSAYPTDYFNYGTNVSASTIIRRAADLWGINPQVILSTLEKEQSLVSGNAGCAGWQYNSAMGMGCPDSGACPAPQYAGFSRQVTKGSWQLMFARQRAEGRTSWNGDGSVTYYGRMTAGNRARIEGGSVAYYDGYTSIDGTNVYLSNGATAALYEYTPHFHGNQNFVLIFERWFGTTKGTFLLQSPRSPAVYLQSGTNRFGVPSYDVLRAYGFEDVKVTPVSDQYIDTLTDGGTLSTVFKKEGEGAVYMADNGYRFGFATTTQCTNWGFPSCLSDAKAISPLLFNQILNAGDMKGLMLNGSTVYLMESGKRRPFLSSQAFQERGYSTTDIVPTTNPINYGKPTGLSLPQNNSFVSFSGTSVIYLYSTDKFYAITSYDLFQSLVSNMSQVFYDADSAYNTQLPTSQRNLTATLSVPSDAKTYLFSGGKKVDVSTVTSDVPAAQNSDDIKAVINAKSTERLATANSTYRTPAGMLFRLSSRQVAPFYSIDDYFSSVYDKDPIAISEAIIQSLPVTNPILAPGGGSLYQVSTSGKENLIYTTSNDGTACLLNSVGQLGTFRFRTDNVRRISETAPAGQSLRGLVKSSSGSLYIVDDGTKTPLSQSAASAWGAGTTSLCSFSDSFLTRLRTVQQNTEPKFARLPNGVIFYAQNNVMHQINSYATFISLGGKSTNTVNVSDDFTSYVTVGSSIQ